MTKKLIIIVMLFIPVTLGTSAIGLIKDPVFLTSENFDQYVRVPGTVVVEFWADWNKTNCYDFKELENAKIYRVDVDKERSLVSRFRILGVPTILIFDEGVLEHYEFSKISHVTDNDHKRIQELINRLQ